MKARDIMTTHVVEIQEDMSLEEAARVLVTSNISGAPVVNAEGKLVGMLTEGDLIRTQKPLTRPMILTFLDAAIPLNYQQYTDELHALTATKVSDLMTEEVFSLGPDSDESDVAQLMIEKQINRVPIVEKGFLLGIISRQDMIRAQIQRAEGSQEDMLP